MVPPKFKEGDIIYTTFIDCSRVDTIKSIEVGNDCIARYIVENINTSGLGSFRHSLISSFAVTSNWERRAILINEGSVAELLYGLF